METASYRILKSITVLTFLLSSIFWLSSQVVSVANQTYPVKNEENQEIGTVTIPYDYAESQILFFVLMVFSGIQLWTITHLGKRIVKVEEELEFTRTIKADPDATGQRR
ncbi:MAG: hypothetical protein CML13_17040 [Puniceicoccaceae bacterium]|nr:hypothetical protein [Puniceicoccaceae bacterium]|tara:strand:- start:3966 stop:4292 length:327 start_codon:yes stop_codon:yes gene_type:complete